MKRDILLVIDDSPIDLAILNEIFKHDFRVKCISNAEQAFHYIRIYKDEICLILLDIYLNLKGSGFSLLQQIRANNETSNLPIALITSDSNKDNVVNAMEHGAIDFLAKPVNPHTVQKRVHEIIQQHWPADSLIGDENDQNAQMFTLFQETMTPAEISLAVAPWVKNLEILCTMRPSLSFSKMKRVAQITKILINNYCMYLQEHSLSETDAKLISIAAIFYDLGLVALPDSVLEGGGLQDEPGRSAYFTHMQIGQKMLEASHSQHLFLKHCSDIIYWHHKNYDGSGYPNEEIDEVPISAQFVHTALQIEQYAWLYREDSDCFDKALEALKKDVGYAISPKMYENAKLSQKELKKLKF